MRGKLFLIVVLVLAVVLGGFTLNSVRAQRPQDIQEVEEKNPLLAVQAIDSRLVDVEKACTADEVTIKKEEGFGSGNANSCEKAKEQCRSKLAKSIADSANKECKIYTKVSDEAEMCKAHRGNFNPTENIKYSPANCVQLLDGTWSVECTNVNAVKYTCN